MRLLIVCQYFFPEPFRITDIARELRKLGHSVTVLTGTPNYPEGRYYPGYGPFKKRKQDFDGARIVRTAIVPRGNGGAARLALNYLSFAVNASIAALGFKKKSFDAILVYQLSPVTMAIPAIVASRRTGAPIALYVMDLWPESLSAGGGISNGAVIGAFGKLVDWIYSKCALTLVSSRGFVDPIRERGVPRESIRYVPQYPEDVYAKAEVALDDPARSEIPPGFNIAFTGNIGEAQGLDILIEVAALLKDRTDIHFILIGDGRARAQLERKIADSGLSGAFRFLGRKPMASIPTYLALCDAALLPLRSELLLRITLPAKLQSYFACGAPVIGSVDGEAAEVISEAGAGFVGPAGDARALAENVIAMRGSGEDARARFGRNGYEYYKRNFLKSEMIGRIDGCLREAADASRGERRQRMSTRGRNG